MDASNGARGPVPRPVVLRHSRHRLDENRVAAGALESSPRLNKNGLAGTGWELECGFLVCFVCGLGGQRGERNGVGGVEEAPVGKL